MAPLEDLVEINPRISKSRLEEQDSVPYVPMSAVSEDGRLLSLDFKAGKSIGGYRYFAEGDVLVAKITPCLENGKALVVPRLPRRHGCGSTEFHVLRAGPEIDRRYLFFMVWNERFRSFAMENMSGTAGQKRLPVSALARFVIPVPTLDEQRRIVGLLDKSYMLRILSLERLFHAKSLAEAIFLDMFGSSFEGRRWPAEDLEHLTDIASGVTKGRKLRGKETSSVPYLRVANVQDGYLDLEDVQEIEVPVDDVEKYRLEPGDVVLTEGGDPDKLGRGAVWTGSIDPCIHQNHIFRVRLDPDRLLPTYFSAYLGSAHGKRYFLRAAKQTTGIASINMTQLRAFPVVVPPLSLQREFAERVERIKVLEKKLEAHLFAAEELFKALSQRAFSGEL